MPHDLVVRARRGEEDAWAELYALHGRRLLVWLRTLAPTDAASSPEDVAQEAWLTAADKIADFHGGDDDFAGWLFGIGRNHFRNRWRMTRRRATDPASDRVAEGDWGVAPDPVQQVVGESNVRWMLAQLSPREAEVVACIDVVGLDVASTARALGIGNVAVRVAHHRALGRLRTLLDRGEGRTCEETPRGE